jgi:hypothetical protein
LEFHLIGADRGGKFSGFVVESLFPSFMFIRLVHFVGSDFIVDTLYISISFAAGKPTVSPAPPLPLENKGSLQIM